MLKRVVSILASTLVLFSAFLSVTPALADGDGSKVEGKIAAVDTAAQTVTITPKRGGPDVVVNVNASTKIKRNDRSAALADLLVGDKVEAKYNPSTMIASKIEAKSQGGQPGKSEIKGTIASVDTAASTITITPSKGGADITFKVDASTIIKKGKKIVTLDALTAGDRVEVKYNPATMLAIKIEVKR